MTTEAQREQIERRQVLRGDLKVREGSTYIDHYAQEAGGRFMQVASAQVVGASAILPYPAAAAHQADPVPQEPPQAIHVHLIEL